MAHLPRRKSPHGFKSPGQSCLVGYTGFVGQSLTKSHKFDALFNRANIEDVRGQSFDLAICAAPDARKWWSNLHPEEDEKLVRTLIENLKTVRARKFVLISTIDVFPVPRGVDERFDCTSLQTHAYGRNRLLVEAAVAAHFPDASIIRLPALFGPGLKKNALFDMINGNETSKIDPASSFQWYDMTRLWQDISLILANQIRLIVLATEPVRTGEIRDAFFPAVPLGQPSPSPASYDVKTIHTEIFGGSDGYIMRKPELLKRIGQFAVQASEGRHS